MKAFKVVTVFMVVALLVAFSAPGIALAGAYEATWASTIAYQNIGAGTATVYIAFYDSPSDTTPDTYPAGTIAQNNAKVIIVGDLVTGTFKGSAVLSADQPLAAVILQVAGTSTIRVRPVSNGFTGGATTTIIPTAFKQAATGNFVVTQFSVQNVGPGQATALIKFLNPTTGLVDYSYSQVIEAGAGHFVDLETVADANLADGWTGPIQIDRTAGTGMLISSAMELNTNANAAPNRAYAFEGVNSGSLILYMPSSACKYDNPAPAKATSYYAIQNPNAGTATGTVTFKWNDGSTTVYTYSIVGYGKISVTGCQRDAGAEPTNKLGSAVIQSNNAVTVIAMGKMFNNTWYTTGFNGVPAGFAKISLPFVRHAATTQFQTGNYQRTWITIQNVSGFDLTVGQVTIKYINYDGTVTTVPLAAILDGAKVSTNAAAGFGYDATYTTSGGGAIIECSAINCKLAVVARVDTYQLADEDYLGIQIP